MTWQKGQSGNPQGRRKGVIEISTILKKQVIRAGLKGKAAKLCREWLESKDPNKAKIAMEFIAKLSPKDIAVTGEGGGPIAIEYLVPGSSGDVEIEQGD
jgi:hypothetical protein